MMRCFEKRRVREWLDTVKRFFKRKPDAPEDTCAYVTAPKKPRPPTAVAPPWRIVLRTDGTVLPKSLWNPSHIGAN